MALVFLLIAGVAGFLAALLIHRLTWTARHNYPALTLAAGVLGALALQAFALKVSWWRGMAGVFFEMAVAFLTGAAVNLSMQRTIPWFDERFPGVDVYALINSFLWALIVTLLALAFLRPLLQLRRS